MTDKILIDRAVVDQALEALSYYERRKIEWDYADEQAITALRQALEAEQQAEPVAWVGEISEGADLILEKPKTMVGSSDLHPPAASAAAADGSA